MKFLQATKEPSHSRRDCPYNQPRANPQHGGVRSSPFRFLAVPVVYACFVMLSVYPRDLIELRSNDRMLRIESTSGRGTSPCQYDGHCPVGSTCAASSTSQLGGVCEPFQENISSATRRSSEKLEQCVQHCQAELEWDEAFYFGAAVQTRSIRVAKASAGRPEGCVLTYERTLGQSLKRGNYSDWIQARQARRIVRVDPSSTEKDETGRPLWKAFCYNPCQSNDDCPTSSNAFVCDQGACQRRPQYWDQQQNTSSSRHHHDLVIVTGATADYYGGLRNFVASVRYWAPKNRVVVYNLGMDESQLEKIAKWPNVAAIQWRDGFPDSIPPHAQIGKAYAWKPLAINESLHEYHNILWIDAGSSLTGPIAAAEDVLHRTGIFLARGQDEDMTNRSSPLTYDWFHVSKDSFVSAPHYAGNVQGYLFPSRYVETIVKPNAACAMSADCIIPAGSNLDNHRFDQTSLSILAHQLQVPHHTEFLASSRHQLNTDLSQPSDRFLWTSRQCNKYYSDRLAHEFGNDMTLALKLMYVYCQNRS